MDYTQSDNCTDYLGIGLFANVIASTPLLLMFQPNVFLHRVMPLLPNVTSYVPLFGEKDESKWKWGALSDAPIPSKSWLLNRSKWHLCDKTLLVSKTEFRLKIPKVWVFVWQESQFTVESRSNEFMFVSVDRVFKMSLQVMSLKLCIFSYTVIFHLNRQHWRRSNSQKVFVVVFDSNWFGSCKYQSKSGMNFLVQDILDWCQNK